MDRPAKVRRGVTGYGVAYQEINFRLEGAFNQCRTAVSGCEIGCDVSGASGGSIELGGELAQPLLVSAGQQQPLSGREYFREAGTDAAARARNQRGFVFMRRRVHQSLR